MMGFVGEKEEKRSIFSDKLRDIWHLSKLLFYVSLEYRRVVREKL
jgi:hypothetical protein